MEGLLILIGIWVLDIVIKKVAANKNKQRQQSEQYQSDEDDEYESQEETQGHTPPRSLQDLVRQFEEAQREASQGTYVPPAPPVNNRRHRDTLTLRDIAEVVIDVDVVNLEFLMEEFEVDENTAAEMLMALQAHRIVGHDMGEGDCDVLIHDMDELDNLLNRAQRHGSAELTDRPQESEPLRLPLRVPVARNRPRQTKRRTPANANWHAKKNSTNSKTAPRPPANPQPPLAQALPNRSPTPPSPPASP